MRKSVMTRPYGSSRARDQGEEEKKSRAGRDAQTMEGWGQGHTESNVDLYILATELPTKMKVVKLNYLKLGIKTHFLHPNQQWNQLW